MQQDLGHEQAPHRRVGFVAALILLFLNGVRFTGRSSRGAYWYAFLWSLILGMVALMVDRLVLGVEPDALFSPANDITALILLVPTLALGVRRLHDIGRSGYWLLLTFTIIGLIPLIYWACLPGPRAPNAHGPDVEAGYT